MMRVTSVAFSPDGSHIVSGSSDNTIHLWDAETGDAIWKPIKGHSSYVSSVAFSPDGSRIVSGSWDDTIRLWDVETGDAIGKALEVHSSGECARCRVTGQECVYAKISDRLAAPHVPSSSHNRIQSTLEEPPEPLSFTIDLIQLEDLADKDPQNSPMSFSIDLSPLAEFVDSPPQPDAGPQSLRLELHERLTPNSEEIL